MAYIDSIAIEVLQGARLNLKWLPTSPFFSGFLCFFCHFEGQWYQTLYGKNHRHYCDLTANQVCCAFQHVVSHLCYILSCLYTYYHI